MGLSGVLDGKGDKPEAAIAIKVEPPDTKTFSARALKAFHANDVEGLDEAMRGFVHACMDEYEHDEPDEK